jgi:3D (Asp-Asp-Asp) domain-containing protein
MARVLGTFLSTAYGPPWVGIQGTGVTATGIDLRDGRPHYVVAVDPSVIPLHSALQIDPNPFGSIVIFRAEDTGSAIKGRRIDFYDWRGRARQLAWGQRNVRVVLLEGNPSRPSSPPILPGVPVLPPYPGGKEQPIPTGEAQTDYAPIIRATAEHLNASMRHVHGLASIIRHLPRNG